MSDVTVEGGWRRGLGLLWLGQIVSHVGDSFFGGLIFFLAMDVTGSASWSGVLIALKFVPALVLGLFAGALVDRYDRRRLMIGADLVRALAVAAIPALGMTGHLHAMALATAVLVLALGTTLFNPAIKALIPELTPTRHLTGAALAFQIAEQAALVGGPLLAAMALPKLGALHLLTVDAATYLFSALCLLALPEAARRQAHRPAAPGESSPGVAAFVTRLQGEVASGLRAIVAEPLIRQLLLFATLDNLLLMGLFQVATPLFVREELGLGADAYLRVQSFYFLGMGCAGALFWVLGRRAPKGPTIIAGLVLDGLTFVPFGFCHTLRGLELALFVHAVAVPLIVIPRTVLLQARVPGPLHGRAFALVNVTVFGMTALSSGLVGWLADRFGARPLFLVLGPLGAVVGLLGLSSKTLRGTR